MQRPPYASSALFRLLAFAALVLGAGIGLRDPQPADEPRFVLAAQQMIETGDWLFPRRGSEYYSHKPPPFMWSIAASYVVVGSWRIAFLLPSLLAALGTLWLVWDLAARLWGRRFAPWAAAALLVTLQFGLQAKRAQIDGVLLFLTTLSLWALVRHLMLKPDWRLSWLGWAAAGFGTITKGVGFLPLLAFLPAALARRLGWRHLGSATGSGSPLLWLAPLAFIAGAGVWFFPMLFTVLGSEDPALQRYANEILFKQTGERYANPWHHIKPAWYFLGTIATLWLPFALALPGLLPAWWRRLKRRDARCLVLLGWGLLVLAFFSASPGKREVYILPALPAFCLAAAPLLPGLLRKAWLQRALLAYIALLALAALALGVPGLLGEPEWERRLLARRGLDEVPMSLFAWMTAVGLGGLAAIAWWRVHRAGQAVLAFTGLLWCAYGLGFMPALDPSSSSRELMQAVGQRIGPDAELALLGWREQQRLQADRRVTDFGFERPWDAQWPEAAAWLREAPERRWLFLIENAVSRCVRPEAVQPVGRANRRDWVLIQADALRPGCEPGPDESFDRRLSED